MRKIDNEFIAIDTYSGETIVLNMQYVVVIYITHTFEFKTDRRDKGKMHVLKCYRMVTGDEYNELLESCDNLDFEGAVHIIKLNEALSKYRQELRQTHI